MAAGQRGVENGMDFARLCAIQRWKEGRFTEVRL